MELQTTYLGLTLKNPLIVSSCRLSEDINNIKKMEAAGAAAVVMYSIFEEEINFDTNFTEYFTHIGADSFGEALTYFPNPDKQKDFLEQHLLHLQQAVKAVNIPIIGSLNAITDEGWLTYALRMQDTGIKALEINLRNFPQGMWSCENIEQKLVAIIKKLKAQLKIPLSVKLSPFFTSTQDVIVKLEQEAGVDGIVLFDRFYYPDFDLDSFKFKNAIQLSDSYEMRLPLKWIMLLRNHIKASLAVSSGVHSSGDALKCILAGANAVMCASCLMQNGIDHIKYLLGGIETWLQTKHYNSIKEIDGLLSKESTYIRNEFERVHYLRALRSWKNPDLNFRP